MWGPGRTPGIFRVKNVLECSAQKLPAGLQRDLQGSSAKIVVIKLFSPILLSLASLVGKEFENSILEVSEPIGKLAIFLSVCFVWIF